MKLKGLFVCKTTGEKVEVFEFGDLIEVVTEWPVRRFTMSKDEFISKYEKW